MRGFGSPQMNFIDAAKIGQSGYATLGIRPEHMTLSRTKGDWKGKVIHVEHLGADSNIYLDFEGAGLVTVRENGESEYGVGETVHVTADAKKRVYFDVDGKTVVGVK